jgi:hypothetical protein
MGRPSNMGAFADGICWRVLDRSRHQFDAVVYFDDGSEVVSNEFSALVAYAAHWTWVSGEPIVFKLQFGMSGRSVLNTYDLNDIRYWVDDGVSQFPGRGFSEDQ